jgi:uncharacterized phage protein gp47/JayE
MQWLILQVLRTTRAATSTGADLDSWMADLSLTRLPAVSATGIVTFSRITPTLGALVPVGTLVRTADGTQTFSVLSDTTNPAWTGTSNGYVVASGLASLDLPVTAVVPGNAGNVQAGAISLLASAVPGIDSVDNASTFLNGRDAETDDAFRRRFRNFIASRSRATPAAVAYAITSIQQGLHYTIQENIGPTGQSSLGQFIVTVDDGSGSPSAALLSTVQAAIEAVRPVGSLFSVHSPSVVTADVSMMVTVASDTMKAPVQAMVGNAVSDYINGLPIGSGLALTKLAQIGYSANSSVINVNALMINGASDDLPAMPTTVIKAGTVAVN